MKKKYDLVATIGKYKNRDGEEKKRYTNVGSVFEDDEGRISIKLDTIPVTPEWSGWLSCYVPKGGDGQPNQHSQSSESKRTAAGGTADTKAGWQDDDCDPLPF
jgi:hypothetical protein